MKPSAKKLSRRPQTESNFWRHFCNFWSIVLYTLIIADYFQENGLIDLIAPATIVLTGALIIFGAEKEFERWHGLTKGRHGGEWYVLTWVSITLFLILMQFLGTRDYQIPAEVLATCIFVVGLVALTEKSKRMYLQSSSKTRSKAPKTKAR